MGSVALEVEAPCAHSRRRDHHSDVSSAEARECISRHVSQESSFSLAAGDVEIGVPRPRGSPVAHGGSRSDAGFLVEVRNVTYKVVQRINGVRLPTTLLHGVSARAFPGQLLAVLGPSGAGKSTLLDAMAGRIDRSSLEGSILVNGRPMGPLFKRLSGYVMQDDQLFPMLTVRETLTFSARLRLPGSMRMAEKRERVEMLIKELGLTSCADTVIGNEQVRGVSGGERRRVSIGVDLIHDPAVLFLDEPTSGLDSTAALNVVQVLSTIARQRSRTIVLTIHQPSFRILELLDSLLVLARGAVVYHGPTAGLLGFLEDFGQPVPDDVTPVEFMLDLLDPHASKEGDTAAQLVSFQKSRQPSLLPGSGATSVPSKAALPSSSAPPTAPPPMTPVPGRPPRPAFASSVLQETLTLCDRSARNICRTPELLLSRAFLMVLMGLILGSVFFHASTTLSGVAARASFFAFSLAFFFFTCTEALPLFHAERLIFIRETSRGAYRPVSYVLASTVVFTPFLFSLAVLFSCVAYFMVGLAATPEAFFRFLLAMFLSLSVANSFVFFVAAVAPNPITGNTIVMSLTAFFFLFSGYFIAQNEIPSYWLWMNYLSTFKYPLQMLTLTEFTSLGSTCWQPAPVGTSLLAAPGNTTTAWQPASSPAGASTAYAAAPASIAAAPLAGGVSAPGSALGLPPCLVTSADVLQSFSMDGASFGVAAWVMVAFFVGYRVLFFLALTLQRSQRK